MSIQTIVAQKSDEGKTLLWVIKEHLKTLVCAKVISVKGIKRAIDGKKCRINGRVEFFSTHPMRAGDRIEIDLVVDKVLPPQTAPPVLFEDEHLIAFNKPSGRTAESFTSFYLVHRLDKETTGVFLLAKTEQMAKEIESLFLKREMKKSYLAICDGQIKPECAEGESWQIDTFLGKIASYQGGALYGKVPKVKGKRSITDFTLLKRGKQASLVEACPHTGRTHQIRVHLKEMGHPVLGDWQYQADFVCPYRPSRHLLHAISLTFSHPGTGEKITLSAPLWPDFIEAQNVLGLL